jgi:hypothetical protein
LGDGAKDKAKILALLTVFYLACKPFAMVKHGSALLITGDWFSSCVVQYSMGLCQKLFGKCFFSNSSYDE